MKKIKALAVAGVFTAALSATAFAEMADVKVGGEIRVRDVITNDYDLNNDAADRNNTVTSRTRVNVDAKIDETTKAYISLQDTRVWGTEGGTATTADDGANGSGVETVDVSQAYLQLDKLFGQPLSLKLGRQVLDYGDARLIGAFEWSNYARRFDGLKLMYNADAFSVDLFTTKVKDQTGTLSTTPGGTEVGIGVTTSDKEDAYFNGLYATVKSIPTSTLDLYLLEKKNTTAGEDMLTYGARINGGAMNIDWTAEAAWQSGDANEDQTKDANFWAVKGGYTIPEAANLRIGAEYVWASGQDDSSDSTKFDQLYPTNHPLYGVSDFGPTNTLGDLQAWSVNASAKPVKGLKLLAEYWNYSTEEDYNDNDAIGTEFNIQAWYALSDNVGLHAYWARFMPDDEYADAKYSGNDDAADNVTLQVAVKF